MVKILVLCALIAAVASAADFTLEIGPPVAAGPGVKVSKASWAFAVRSEGCDDPANNLRIFAATAEGLIDDVRSSVPVTPIKAGKPGVYLVSQNWPSAGVWVVSLSAACGPVKKTGAIVRIRPQSSEVYRTPGPPTAAEVEAELKAGGNLLHK
jgi:hypothetical protein